MHMSPIQPIPPDLVDQIIDHCHADKATLRILSRVCKTWKPASRYHLFSSIRLDPLNLTPFLRLLKTPSSASSIGPLVTHLDLETDYNLPLFIRAIPSLSKHLPQVRSLRLEIRNEEEIFEWKYGIRSPPRARQDLTGVFLGIFPTITLLELWITCDTLLEVVGLSTSFPSLESLALSVHLTCESHSALEQDAATAPLASGLFSAEPSRLRKLTLMRAEPYVIRWLLRHQPLPRPSRLSMEISFMTNADISNTGRFLRGAGGDLQHLSLKSAESIYLLYEHIELSNHDNLRSLAVHVWMYAVPVMIYLLSSLSSTVLEELDFAAWESEDDGEDGRCWAKLNALLSGPRFVKLRRVTVDVNEERSVDLAERLSDIYLRGIMHFRNQRGVVYSLSA
ncbi:hypothetical protein D9615_005424 [Tricholomella constricta]|uniref:F-box domain-containing protein n=1 Tax=Tricholomella constricta TaxID=117010 RepID=A0A8H5HEM7_9AGAR|nr:hypothetical protein D9615_005424 [Tricholomella constricta]